MQESVTRFILEQAAWTESRLAKLLPGFELDFDPAIRRSKRFLDTFDWRLYEAGMELFAESARQRLTVSLRDRGQHRKTSTVRCSQVPRFAVDMPPGPTREMLSKTCSARALLPIVRVSYRERAIRVLNADRKTVVRLWVFSEGKAAPEQNKPMRRIPDTIEVTGVLGYNVEVRSVLAALSEAGISQVDSDLLDLSLAAIGRVPLDYTSRPRVILDPGLTMDEALRTVLIHLTRAVRANERGLLGDVDVEFLHDFRVATRRTRSVISQFKKGISPKVLKTFRPGFKWLGKVTGPTRDADVYLEHVDGYRAGLPEEVGEQLLPLREFLERRRAREFKAMVRALKTTRYHRLLSQWESLLMGTDSPGAGPIHNRSPVLPAVSARIWKVYRRIMKEGRAITPSSPAAALHNLRLVCKNLRYLLEIFRSLYPAEAIGKLISELKMLQNNLGDIQDLEVQRHALDSFARDMLEEGPVASGTVMAMGRLAASLEDRQRNAREEFADRFARFSRKRNRRSFRKLFNERR